MAKRFFQNKDRLSSTVMSEQSGVILRRCCYRVGLATWGRYFCTACGANNCFLHAALWTDEKRRCCFCFSPTKCLKEPDVFPSISSFRNWKLILTKRRVLLVVDGLYIAGAQRLCVELLDIFSELGFQSTVVALEGGGRWAERFVSRAERVVLCRDDAITWNSLQQLLGYSDFEFVSAHLAAGLEWTARHVPSSIRAFAHLHSEPSSHERLDGSTIHSTLKRFDRIFVPSNATLEKFHQYFNSLAVNPSALSRMQTFPNGLLNHRNTLRSKQPFEKRGPGDALNVAVVSRIDDDKFSVELFAETVVFLRRKHPSIKVLVAGDGECMHDVRCVTEVAGVGDVVSFLGFVDDLELLYRWADVVFLPSKREGMPYVLIECLAASRPLVAPNLGIFREISIPGQIFTFPPCDAQAAASEILLAISTLRDNSSFEQHKSPQGLLAPKEWLVFVKEAYKLV